MDKYEYRVKTEQMMEHMEKKQYKKAMEIADTIDWRRVKNATMLNTVSEIYEFNGEFQKSRDILFVAFDRAPSSRKIVYRLGILALKIQDTEEASDCYEEFVKLAPKDPNQYILKYKILKAQGSPLSEQISALSEFKKAEYVEKWAYELAKLYHEAGMTAECLEECDDLILWFSEGKYVYQAMELKMQYKPLTPLQQEKYDSYGGKKSAKIRRPQSASRPIPKKEDPSAQRPMVKSVPSTTAVFSELPEEALSPQEEYSEGTEEGAQADETRKFPTGELTKALAAMEAQNEKIQEAAAEEPAVTDAGENRLNGPEKEKRTPITTVVKGATLEEALANGVAMANGINREEKRRMEQREEEIRISGQMKIEDILQEWEEKQKANAEAIEEQRTKDEERLRKEREEREARREAQRLEAEKREAEAVARRRAEAEAREEARKEAERKAAEEKARKEAERKAAEEEARKEAERKAAEEEARKEAERKAAEEEARKEAERKAAEEEARKEAERKAAEEEARKEAERKAAEEEANKEAAKKRTAGKVKKTLVLSDDIRQLVEELEGKVAEEDLETGQTEDTEDSYQMELDFLTAEDEEAASEEDALGDAIEKLAFESGDGFDDGSFDESEDGFDDGGVQESEETVAEESLEESDGDFEGEYEESEEDFNEEDFEEEDYEESEEDLDEEDFEEEEYEESEEDFDEEDFEEGEYEESEEDFDEEDFEEEDYEESEEDFDEEDFEEEDYEESEEEFDEEDFDEDEFEEAEFDEEDAEDFSEDDFDEEEDFDEDEFEEEDLEGDFDEDEFEEEDFFEGDELPQVKAAEKEAPLEIEEPSEEEIQKRIKKSKGSGVPFDTGFVVTGRYDLSATSEIGLKAGLTEEQKKLFSYFVPVRGMSEQIVEALDNDRRAQREGTSKTGNLLVIGRKGSGKTVLAVDIVKAIQKQRNLKQGKVAIVTGESLNKKELSNIIQKLRGGAIIIEKAGKLNSRTIKELSLLMEKKTGEMLFVLEDQRKPLERILTAHPDFKKKFTSRLELPVFINDELVTFGQTYAKENGYKLDEMGILALYSRIDVMQREDHAVTVAEVKDIMDEAIAHSQKANVKHLARRMFGKSTDSSDRIILKEEDFKI